MTQAPDPVSRPSADRPTRSVSPIDLPSRLSLAQLPTRIHQLGRLSEELPVDLFIKRDDETGLELSGNKIRKLEFLLAEALHQNADSILTCGGVQSNHGRATAVAARRLGMDCHLFLRTTDGTAPQVLEGNLLLDHLVGAKLNFISPAEYARRREHLETAANDLRHQGRRPYVIPEGGSNALGSCGYVALAAELLEQSASFDHIVCATGSGGTAAGLHLGRHLAGLDAHVWGVPVCDDGAYFGQRVTTILAEFAQRFGADSVRDREGVSAQETLDHLHFLDGYKGPAYAVPYPEELALIKELAGTEGVLLDPVYTGKALYGLVTEARRGRFDSTSARRPRVLFLHTGGVWSLFAYREELTA